jgi:hypothetical protein
VDTRDQIVIQADGIPIGYPPARWQCGKVFNDTRTLTLPANTPDGDYRLLIGWYRLSDGVRLDAQGDGMRPDDLFEIPIKVKQP